MFRALGCLCLLLAASGCAGRKVPCVVQPNPLPVPVADREFVWNQVIDVVDDYFTIEREERVQLLGDVETEGRIDTFPVIGATLLEPWRHDSVGGYERLESTLQTIRRFATVRVIPAGDSYLIDVAVFKDLEDLNRPEHAVASEALIRYDNSLTRIVEPVGAQRIVEGWIPLGRDPLLEQQMLAEIRARLGSLAAPVAPVGPVLLRAEY